MSRTSNIAVSAYLRTAPCVQSQDDMGNDLLMARVDLAPVLDTHVSSPSLSPSGHTLSLRWIPVELDTAPFSPHLHPVFIAPSNDPPVFPTSRTYVLLSPSNASMPLTNGTLLPPVRAPSTSRLISSRPGASPSRSMLSIFSKSSARVRLER